MNLELLEFVLEYFDAVGQCPLSLPRRLDDLLKHRYVVTQHSGFLFEFPDLNTLLPYDNPLLHIKSMINIEAHACTV